MNTRVVQSVLYIIVIFLIAGCEKEYPEKREYPQVHTGQVTQITASGARFYGDIINSSGAQVDEHGFVWGTNEFLSEQYAEKVLMGSTSDEGEY